MSFVRWFRKLNRLTADAYADAQGSLLVRGYYDAGFSPRQVATLFAFTVRF